MPELFTIGHSTHSWEKFLELLRQHRIEAVADVRSSPYSQFNPQFNRETLQAALRQHGISYVFLGEELGAPVGSRMLCQRPGGLCAHCPDTGVPARAEFSSLSASFDRLSFWFTDV
jgi:uncharacterized protein (DUF488 family)